MKKFYAFFLIAMVALVSGVNAHAGWYISGGFQNWNHCNANYELKETTSGVFVLDLSTAPVKTISGEFLIVQGTPGNADWNNKIGTNGQKVKADTEYKYVKGAGNFTMDGSVENAVITLDTNKGTLLIAGAAQENDYDTVYLIGDFGSGWSENTPTAYGLTLKEGTTNVWTGNFEFTAATSYFKMKAGALVYGTGGGDVAVVLDTEYTASQSGNAYSLTAGKYTFTFTLDKNADTGVLVVTGEVEENNDEYGIVGTMNGWSIDNLIPMTKQEDGTFVYTAESLPAGTEFKIGTVGKGWPFAYGANNGNVVTVDTPMSAYMNADPNFLIGDALTNVTITFKASGANGTVTVSGTVKEEAIYLYYFNNTAGWENVYAYAWNYGGESLLGAWPGTEMVALGNDLYVISSTSKLPNIIFNEGDGGMQTNDLVPVNGDCYNADSEKIETPDTAEVLTTLATPEVEGDVVVTEENKIEGKVAADAESFTVTFAFPIAGMEIHYKIDPEETPVMLDNAPARVEAEEGWSVATEENPTVEVPLGSGKLTAKAVLAEGVESNAVTYDYEVSKTVTGVNNVEVEAAEAVYYNLQGVRVANPANGVFIRVSADKAVKVVL